LKGIYSYARLAAASMRCLRAGLQVALQRGELSDHLLSRLLLADPVVQPLLRAVTEMRRVQVLEADRIAMMLLGAVGYDPRCLLQVAGQEGRELMALRVMGPIVQAGSHLFDWITGQQEGGSAQQVALARKVIEMWFPVSMDARVRHASRHLDLASRRLQTPLRR
jgi:hypothetical protein